MSSTSSTTNLATSIKNCSFAGDSSAEATSNVDHATSISTAQSILSTAQTAYDDALNDAFPTTLEGSTNTTSSDLTDLLSQVNVAEANLATTINVASVDTVTSSSSSGISVSGTSEIVDVLANYSWKTNTSSSSSSASNIGNIPWICLIEREQTVSSVVSNILNIVGTSSDITGNVETTLNTLIKSTSDATAKTALEAAKTTVSTISSYVNLINSTIADYTTSGTSTNLSGYLNPYSKLYYTQQTGKAFIFPFLSQTPTINVTNGYEVNNSGFLSGMLNLIEGYASGIGKTIMDIKNISNQGKGRIDEFEIEMAKSYKFNSDGEEITITFPLYNTVKADSWKSNYNLLLLFTLRNMPVKKNASTYSPPVLYDVIIPGIKRLPIAYVSAISITPLGLQRTMTLDKSYLPLGTTSVPVVVPEAWNVSIKLKSLLSNTANTLLSSYVNLPITVSSSS